MANFLLNILLTNGKSLVLTTRRTLLHIFDKTSELQKELVARLDNATCFVGSEENMFEVIHNRSEDLDNYREVCACYINDAAKLNEKQYLFNIESPLLSSKSFCYVNCIYSNCDMCNVDVKSLVVNLYELKMFKKVASPKYTPTQQLLPVTGNKHLCLVQENKNNLCINDGKINLLRLKTHNIKCDNYNSKSLWSASTSKNKILGYRDGDGHNKVRVSNKLMGPFVNCFSNIGNDKLKTIKLERIICDVSQNYQIAVSSNIPESIQKNTVVIGNIQSFVKYINKTDLRYISKLLSDIISRNPTQITNYVRRYNNERLSCESRKMFMYLHNLQENNNSTINQCPDEYCNKYWRLKSDQSNKSVILADTNVEIIPPEVTVKNTGSVRHETEQLNKKYFQEAKQFKHKLNNSNTSDIQMKTKPEELQLPCVRKQSKTKKYRYKIKTTTTEDHELKTKTLQNTTVGKKKSDLKYVAEINALPRYPPMPDVLHDRIKIEYLQVSKKQKRMRNLDKLILKGMQTKITADPWFKDTKHMSALLRVNTLAFNKLEKHITRALLQRNLVGKSAPEYTKQKNLRTSLIPKQINTIKLMKFSHLAHQQRNSKTTRDDEILLTREDTMLLDTSIPISTKIPEPSVLSNNTESLKNENVRNTDIETEPINSKNEEKLILSDVSDFQDLKKLNIKTAELNSLKLTDVSKRPVALLKNKDEEKQNLSEALLSSRSIVVLEESLTPTIPSTVKELAMQSTEKGVDADSNNLLVNTDITHCTKLPQEQLQTARDNTDQKASVTEADGNDMEQRKNILEINQKVFDGMEKEIKTVKIINKVTTDLGTPQNENQFNITKPITTEVEEKLVPKKEIVMEKNQASTKKATPRQIVHDFDSTEPLSNNINTNEYLDNSGEISSAKLAENQSQHEIQNKSLEFIMARKCNITTNIEPESKNATSFNGIVKESLIDIPNQLPEQSEDYKIQKLVGTTTSRTPESDMMVTVEPSQLQKEVTTKVDIKQNNFENCQLQEINKSQTLSQEQEIAKADDIQDSMIEDNFRNTDYECDRQPQSKHSYNRLPLHFKKDCNVAVLPLRTFWATYPRARTTCKYLEKQVKKSKYHFKKYKYETKEVQSITGEKVKVTTMVPDDDE